MDAVRKYTFSLDEYNVQFDNWQIIFFYEISPAGSFELLMKFLPVFERDFRGATVRSEIPTKISPN